MIIVTTDIIRGGNNFGDTFDVNTIDEAIFILENSFSLTNVNVIKNYKLKFILLHTYKLNCHVLNLKNFAPLFANSIISSSDNTI